MNTNSQLEDGQVDITASIEKMNKMYSLPTLGCPGFGQVCSRGTPTAALKNFRSILAEEIKELDAIIRLSNIENPTRETTLNLLVDMADFLGDVIVYCMSEALKYGIDIGPVLYIIMESNFSKLGKDGLPVKDERGKFQKGPNYWRPERLIRLYLNNRIEGFSKENSLDAVKTEMKRITAEKEAANRDHPPSRHCDCSYCQTYFSEGVENGTDRS